MGKGVLKNAFMHTFNEIEFPNIILSIENNFEKIQKAHDSIHEFLYLAPFCLPKNKEWHEKSAFLTYHYVALDMAHRSLLDALAGYYNAANILLRSTLELLIKGAFWECLAHKKFRDTLEKSETKKGKKTLKGWIDDLITHKAEIETELEENSGAIFDKIAVIFNDPQFKKKYIYVPNIYEITEQLATWNIFNPIPNPTKMVYGETYKVLCEDVHVIPNKTDIGRRLLSQKNLFKVELIPKELNNYLELLHKIMDIGIVIELNILSSWISQDKKVQNNLKKRLKILEDLELSFAYKKIYSLVKKRKKPKTTKKTKTKIKRQGKL